MIQAIARRAGRLRYVAETDDGIDALVAAADELTAPWVRKVHFGAPLASTTEPSPEGR